MKSIFSYKNILVQLSILLLGILLFIPGLDSVHLFDWDEINFAESAREMLVTRDYLTVQINFEPFWEKPPLFIWLQAAAMHVWGINEFAARIPNAICGVLTLLVLFNIGCNLKNIRLGFLWVLTYVGSVAPFFYFKSGIIDPWFNLFIFLGIYYFVLFTAPNNKKYGSKEVALSAMFLGLAILTKGPVGFLIFLLTFLVYLVVKRFKFRFKFKQIVLFLTVLVFVGGFWFLLQVINGNLSVIRDFIIYQIRLFETKDAGHGGFLFYHFVVLLVGVFPASIIAIHSFKYKILERENSPILSHFFCWMMILFWVVLLLFTVVRTKIIHYSSMCYFPLTFLAAYYMERVIEGKERVRLGTKILLVIVAVIFAVAIAILPFFDKFKDTLIPLFDEFTKGNLQATSTWVGFEWLIGVVLVVGTLLFCVFVDKQPFRSICYLFISSMVFIFLTTLFVVPQVEKYTQGAVVEFYRSKRQEDCYVFSMYKSYAHYFYTDRQKQNSCANEEFLRQGDIDKNCYFVVRNVKQQIDKFEKNTKNAVLLYSKNGFSFYVRYPQMD